MDKGRPLKLINFPLTFKGGIWLLGAIVCFLGIVDRAVAAFSDGQLSLQDGIQLGAVILFFFSWFYLKPASNVDSKFLARTNHIQTLNELKNSKFN